ncbi:MAG TPA: hypothetical protein VFK04_12870 [Gemmatimonadaceae bacterium]|nr:hypothetical protein [Gemmatimonadaceae bacterium]
MTTLRSYATDLAITFGLIACIVLVILAAHSIRDCYRKGGQPVWGVFGWPVCVNVERPGGGNGG